MHDVQRVKDRESQGRRVSKGFSYVLRCFPFEMNTHLTDLFCFPFPRKLVVRSKSGSCFGPRGTTLAPARCLSNTSHSPVGELLRI